MKKLKVVHVCISDARGGAAIAVNRLQKAMNTLAKDRIKSKILVFRKYEQSEEIIQVSGRWNKFLQKLSLLIEMTSHKFKNPLFGLYTNAWLGTKIAKEKVIEDSDVVYIHWIGNGYVSMATLRSIISKKPVLFFCHDMWFVTGGCHYSYDCQSFAKNCNNCFYFENPLAQKLSSYNLNQKVNSFKPENVEFVAPSSLFAKNLSKSSVVGPNREVKYIPNLLDIEKYKTLSLKFRDREEGSEKRIVYGAFGGVNNSFKGWKDFENAINIVHKAKPDQNIIIDIFGHDFNEDELKNIPFPVKSHGIIHKEEDLIRIYSNGDLFVFPSIIESFGQTLAEALSCGLPAVAYPVGIAPELICEQNGHIAPLHDFEDLAKGILKVLSHPNPLEMKKTSYEIVKKVLDPEKIISSHLNLISNLTNGK